jgi:S-formylglutathione hydrolase
MKIVSQWKSFGGTLSVHAHESTACACEMTFAVYTPPQAKVRPVPVLWYLSGLTCNWSNVMEKSGLQRHAAELGLMVVAPDTSPRGGDVPDDEAYDLGQGAGFYLDALEEPWAEHFRMETYLRDELPALLLGAFPGDAARQGVMGHSMGGHGALTFHLKDPETYRSCSALAPVSSPCSVPWGKKAFAAYLGPDLSAWGKHDASRLVAGKPTGATILVDTGSADPFLEEQLRPHLFEAACRRAGQPLTSRLREGYDHSYYFVASVIGEHLAHHADTLSR